MMKEVPNNAVCNLSCCTVFFFIKRKFAIIILQAVVKPKPL